MVLQEYRVEVRQNAMNLALTCAQNKSRRSGFGWVLLDMNGGHLSSGGLVIGDSKNTAIIVERLEEHTQDVCDIIITGDPVAAMLNLSELLPVIENSSYESITVGYNSDILFNAEWQNWLSHNLQKVYHIPVNQISERLHSGPKKLHISGRPWLTSVSAGTLDHYPLNLTSLGHEFGFYAHFNELVEQYRTVLYTPSQKDIFLVGHESGYTNEISKFVEVTSVGDVIRALDMAATTERTCVLLICDIVFLKQCISNELCDEIVLHIGFTAGKKSPEKINQPSVQFENWSILDCETVGQCIRLTLEKDNGDNVNLPQLSSRLN